jgi:hypothetical protein
MMKQKPSLAARALSTLVDRWPLYSHGSYISGNLSLAGFSVLNNGNFSSVIEGMPGQVIKVFGLNDLGYQHMIQYTSSATSDNLVKVYSFTKSGQYGIVELESLQHRTREAVSISEYIDKCKHNPAKVKHRWGDHFRDLILDLNQSIQNFSTSQKIKMTWDCHEDNIMFRGKIPVLIDVVYAEGQAAI